VDLEKVSNGRNFEKANGVKRRAMYCLPPLGNEGGAVARN